jgi:acetyl-CoA acetyltransferase
LDHEHSPCSSRFLQYGDRFNNAKSQTDGLKRGVVALCIGGGQGIVLAVESL